MAYRADAPWYYAADGSLQQAIDNGDGWEYPDAPMDEDGRQVRQEDNYSLILPEIIKRLGFNPDDKRVNPDQSVSIMNPTTNQYEQAVAAGDVGTYMPLSMAQEQNLPIYQYAQEPKDTGTLGQFIDVGTPLAQLAAIALAANTAGGNLGSLFGESAASVPAAANAGVETFPLAAQSFPTAVELGAGGAGSAAWSVPGLAETAALGGAAAGAGMSATEASMLEAARNAQLNTLAGNGMTGMASGIAGGAAGALQNILDTTGIGSTVGNVLGGAASGAIGNGSYQIPWAQIIGGLGEYVGQQQYGKDIADAMKYAVDKADPFASQRPFYQGELNKMFTDPNYFQNNALLKGANDMAVNDTTRKLASQGYNMSGNVPMEVGQRLQQNNMSFAQNLMNQTGGFAGAGFGPGQAGTIAGNMGTAGAQTGLNSNGALGTMFNAAYNGQQPTLANQVLKGQQPNQNLYQYLFT